MPLSQKVDPHPQTEQPQAELTSPELPPAEAVEATTVAVAEIQQTPLAGEAETPEPAAKLGEPWAAHATDSAASEETNAGPEAPSGIDASVPADAAPKPEQMRKGRRKPKIAKTT
jgi:hypothetical protein